MVFMSRSSAPATRRRRRSVTCARSAPTPSACRRCRKRWPRGTWGSRSSASRASATWRRGCCRGRSIMPTLWKRRVVCAGSSSRCWRAFLAASDETRVSVALVEVNEGAEEQFLMLAREFAAIVLRKGYGHSETIRDEAHPRRFYAVRQWINAKTAEDCHADREIQAVTARIYQLARVTHVVNGVRKPDRLRLMLEDRRARMEADRRSGFDRRVRDVG